MRRGRTFLFLLLAAGIALATFAAAHRVFLGRLLTFPRDTPILSVDWYEPKEPVPGAFSAPLPSATPSEAGIAPAALERAARWAEEQRSAALLVMRDGRVVFERAFAGHDLERPTTSYSMAKTLLGLLVGVALREGALASLDEPVATFVPEWTDGARRRIRIDDLLRMQSGLEEDGDREDPFSPMIRTHLSEDAAAPALARAAVEPPGRRFEYRNLDSQLLALCLERATGERYAELLSTRLWRPLGARDAAIWLDRDGGSAKAYCCVFARARDWARVGEMMRLGGAFEGRRIVDADWIERMLEPSPFEPRYGRHVWRHEGDEVVPPFFYLDGGRKQRVWVVRSHRLVVVRVGERAPDWDELAIVRTIVEGIDA
ncbi:MAG: serine hydrolase domain-containing protein [Planctomycetota bacterium JB042]